MAYAAYLKVFHGPDFARLRALGARPQRVLWASVGTKNPDYPDTLYVDELVGPETVSTMPPETYAAVRDHGRTAVVLTEGLDEAREQIASLARFGIDFSAVTGKLLDVGVQRFSDDFSKLMGNIEKKRNATKG
jgi:transaldolase